MSQINIPKSSEHVIPPISCRGYGFDIEGNPIIVKEDGSIEFIGNNNPSAFISNIIANRGVGLYANRPLDPVNNDIYVTNDTFVSYVYSDSLADWIANILVKNQFVTDTSTANKPLYQYNGAELIQLTFPSDEITGGEIADLLEALTGDDRLDASAIKNLDIQAGIGGYSSNVYFSQTDSDILGYKKQSATNDPGETIISPTVTSGEGDKLLYQYLFNLPANIATIQQGNWSFTFCSYVSSTIGDTRIGFRPFRYTALGEKIHTFSSIVWGDEINRLVREYKTITSIQEQKTINTTDRLGCDLYIKTSSSAAITVNIVVGDGQALFMNAPIALRHSALRDLNADTNYLHHTSAQASQWSGKQDNLGIDPINGSATLFLNERGNWVPAAGSVTDYENIFFEVAAQDKAYITRGFAWKIASITEYSGTSTIKTSSGATYTIGSIVSAGDYLTVTNTTINARLVAIIQPA